MIFRNIALSLRNRNWGTVILEVLILVVGVFVGLQVDDWNNARQDRQDEQLFLVRLHSDILLAEQVSQRVRDRRFENLQFAISAGDVLFERVDRDILTDNECRGVASSSAMNIAVADLPSLSELIATGRLNILRNDDIRNALLSFEQSKNSLNQLMLLQTLKSPDLVVNHPHLIQRESYFEPAENEVRATFACDTDGMRTSQAFLNEFSNSLDMYDAYIRDGLAPWSEQMNRIHDLIDAALGENRVRGDH